MKKIVTVFLSILLVSMAFGNEGMFLLNDYPVKEAKRAGLKLKPNQIYSTELPSVSDAIVQIGGGTGSFVSANGLVVTNHHVAFRAVQQLSTTENNHLENGFYADSYEKELYARGYRAVITLDFAEVTDQVLVGVDDSLEPAERIKKIENNIKAIVAKTEEEEFIHAYVKKMYNGLKYYVFRMLEFEDIRLVYNPPRSIGEYGGDIDNWMWPRHTGDFSFFRVYMSPEGNPAKFSENNIPYTPKSFLPFSSKGVKEDDFTMIIGYPGRTERYLTANYAEFTQNVIYPNRIKEFKSIIDMIEEFGTDNPKVKLMLQSRLKSYNNVYKNNQGMLVGFEKLNLIHLKKQRELELLNKLQHTPSAQKYEAIFKEIEEVENQKKSVYKRNDIMSWVTKGSRLTGANHSIYRWAIEQEKDDMDRDMGYMDRDKDRRIRSTKTRLLDFYEPLEKRILNKYLNAATSLPEGMTLTIIDEIQKEFPKLDIESAISKYVDRLFAETVFKDVDMRVKAYSMSLDELLALNDPFINFVKILEEQSKLIREEADEVNGKLVVLMPQYFQAMVEFSDTKVYPDANFSVRMTFGKVKGYEPQDAVTYDYITSLNGLLLKNTGNYPFDSPDKFLNIAKSYTGKKYRDKYLKDVPVNFLHTTDITGGNSGSPVMNGKGEFIGIAFDGNWEAMTSDWVFDEDLTRTISVDARYILFVLDKYSHADALLNEMLIK